MNTPAFTLPKECYSGMALRDYFAEGAMRDCINQRGFLISVQEIAKRAYEVADAMLAEREKMNAPTANDKEIIQRILKALKILEIRSDIHPSDYQRNAEYIFEVITNDAQWQEWRPEDEKKTRDNS